MLLLLQFYYYLRLLPYIKNNIFTTYFLFGVLGINRVTLSSLFAPNSDNILYVSFSTGELVSILLKRLLFT